MSKIKIFCIPYAGGSATIYNKWKRYIGNEFEIIPVELAGRGSRFNERLYTRINDVVNDIYSNIKDLIDDTRYIIFGHSMGVLIAYELVWKIIQEGKNKPIQVFFSGKVAPHINISNNNYHKESDSKLINELFSLGGTPEELLSQRELLDIFLSIIRADYEVIETYNYKSNVEKFDFPINILNGDKDKLTKDNIEEWKDYTNNKFKIYNFDGGHFFINDYIREICEIIEESTLELED